MNREQRRALYKQWKKYQSKKKLVQKKEGRGGKDESGDERVNPCGRVVND